MARELKLAGFLLSTEEWEELDESSRLDYLQVFIDTSPPRADGWVYESYELSIDTSVHGECVAAASADCT